MTTLTANSFAMLVNPVHKIEVEERRDRLAYFLSISLTVLVALSVVLNLPAVESNYLVTATDKVIAGLFIGVLLAKLCSPATHCLAKLLSRFIIRA